VFHDIIIGLPEFFHCQKIRVRNPLIFLVCDVLFYKKISIMILVEKSIVDRFIGFWEKISSDMRENCKIYLNFLRD
jgi:hypothetical protein